MNFLEAYNKLDILNEAVDDADIFTALDSAIAICNDILNEELLESGLFYNFDMNKYYDADVRRSAATERIYDNTSDSRRLVNRQVSSREKYLSKDIKVYLADLERLKASLDHAIQNKNFESISNISARLASLSKQYESAVSQLARERSASRNEFAYRRQPRVENRIQQYKNLKDSIASIEYRITLMERDRPKVYKKLATSEQIDKAKAKLEQMQADLDKLIRRSTQTGLDELNAELQKQHDDEVKEYQDKLISLKGELAALLEK